MRSVRVFVGVALLACGAGAQEVVWTYAPPAGHVDVSPGIGDLDGDGLAEIVVGSTAGLALALDGAGAEIWRRDTGSAVCIPPTLADVTGSAGPEVLIMNRQGRVLCLDGPTGNIVWDTALPSPPEWGSTTLAVHDLDGDGAQEIVTGTRDGMVVCLRASGEQAWLYQGGLGKVLCPAIADLDGDGQAEILVGSEKISLVCLAANGKELWRLDQGQGGSPLVCDLSGTGTPAIVTGIGKTLQALDATGKPLWSCPMQREIDSAITVADADGDGAVEVYAADLAGHFVCVSAEGAVRWTASVEQRVRRSPSVGDVDGDGVMEILVAGYSRAIHVFDPQGNLKTRISLPGASNATATLAALGDAGLGVVVPVAMEAVQILRWQGATRDAKVAWPEYRHDARRTGALLPAATPAVTLTAEFGRMHVGTNYLKAVVQNPALKSLTVRLEIARNHGAPAVTEAASEETLITKQVAYSLPANESSDLKLVCSILEGSRVLARREHTAHVVPFAREIADVDGMLAAVRERLPKLLDARGIEERAFFLAASLDRLRPRVDAAGSAEDSDRAALRESLAALLRDAAGLEELSALAAGAAAEGRTTVVRAANPWRPFGGINDLATDMDGSKELAVSAFGGEKESAALNVFNFSSQARSFRLEFDVLALGDQAVPARTALSLFEVIDVPTERCDLSADALAALNAANVVQVPAWSARQIWINVDSGPLAPGDWKGSLLLRTLDVAPIEIRVPLAVTVWKAHLPEKQALRQCGWGYVSSSMLKDQPEAALRDQVEHGTDVFVATMAPKAQFDADGNLVGAPDFAAHDAYVKEHAPHGIILFCGYQGALAGPADPSTDTYGRAHVQWLRAWVKHLAELGVGYDGFALYPVDEPGLNVGLVEAYLRMAKLAREADSSIQLYTDPVGGISVDELRTMLPYVDIWCPNRGGLILDKANAPKLEVILGSGKAVWTYECDDNAKHLTPLGYYRGLAWLAWRHGMTGIGFWSYCTSQDDPWFVPKARYDYLLVYPGNGVVGSKRWEAVRDGIEDYGMLTVLKEAMAAKDAAAEHVLKDQAASIAAFCVVDDDNVPPLGTDETAVRARLADEQWAEVQSVRREMARLLDGP